MTDCCQLLLENKQTRYKYYDTSKREKVEEIEKVTEGAPDIWAYFFSFYILPISYDVFPNAVRPPISQVREGVGDVLQV